MKKTGGASQRYQRSSKVFDWLVVSTPLNNISQLGLFFPIYGDMNTVPNHQALDQQRLESKATHTFHCHIRVSYQLIVADVAPVFSSRHRSKGAIERPLFLVRTIQT